MNTEKLYFEHGHSDRFEARVTACRERAEGGFEVVLDRTLFFPEGGGQPSDSGVILYEGEEIKVTDAHEREGLIYHFCDRPLPEGARVTGVIDFEKRFRRMQNHSGEHIISGIAHRLYGCENVGFHMGSEDVTIDFDIELDENQVDTLELEANRAVWKDLPFRNLFPTASELERLDYRSKKELTGQVRLVEVEGVDLCACCAPHVSRSGEIGIIKILFFIRYKGGVRLHVLCGADALDHIISTDRQATGIARTLSLKHHEIYEGVLRLSDGIAALKKRNGELISALITRIANDIQPTDGNTVVFCSGVDGSDMRALANAVAGKTGGICAVFSKKEDGYAYVMASASVDLRAASKEINAALGGRGGGSPTMIQGSCTCAEPTILGYFKTDTPVRAEI